MTVAYLRSGSARYDLAAQEGAIRAYAAGLGLAVERTVTEAAAPQAALEEREELLADFRSLKEGDRLLAASFTTLTHRAGELVKLLDCLFKRGVVLHLCDRGIILERTTPAAVVIDLLASVREGSMERGESRMGKGRPEGSRSASKFDVHRDAIVRGLEAGKNASELARELGVSRTSLNDYIRSRKLKEAGKEKGETMERSVPLPERTCPLQEKRNLS